MLSTLAGVLGFPVGHSRSPAMMNAAFAELRLDWRYVKLPVPPARFVETVKALPASGYAGANVTIPHKLAAHDLADELSGAARAIGAANTLIFEDGRVLADNTDAGGLLDALDAPARGARALVLGAGGAGRAAAWALNDAGADVAVWNRTPDRAAALAREFGIRHAQDTEPTDILVNTTSIGLHPGEDAVVELGLDRHPAPRVVVDLVYGPKPTALARWATREGAGVVDGVEVLVRQGARSLRRWTGLEAPVETMRRGARGATV